MKTKISVSIDNDILSQIDAYLQQGVYRNKSHFVEFAVRKLIEGERK